MPAGGLPIAAYTDRLQHNQLFTKQEYAQYVWHVIKDLDVTGGIKHVSFERDLVSPVNQKTQLPVSDYEHTWTRNLASLDAHYKLMENWSAYAQWAQGFLAPNLNTLYVSNPKQDQLQPQATTNVQVGMTWVGQAVSVSVDAYTINFNNQLQKEPASLLSGNSAYVVNAGAARYRGIEAEGTYAISYGVSIYANASVNSPLHPPGYPAVGHQQRQLGSAVAGQDGGDRVAVQPGPAAGFADREICRAALWRRERLLPPGWRSRCRASARS